MGSKHGKFAIFHFKAGNHDNHDDHDNHGDDDDDGDDYDDKDDDNEAAISHYKALSLQL